MRENCSGKFDIMSQKCMVCALDAKMVRCPDGLHENLCESCGDIYDSVVHGKVCPLCDHVDGSGEDRPFHFEEPGSD